MNSHCVCVLQMWPQAVWMEKKRKMELVIASNWVKENVVLWPTVSNAKKALEDRREPQTKWR